MKCLILAAGYATRLYPLTENFPKPLLKVGDKTILDWLVDDLDESNKIDEYVVISNAKFAEHFDTWAKGKKQKITVVNDGTYTNETRLGAVKDIEYALNERGIDDDVLIIAGDNVLDFSLTKFVDYAIEKGSSSIMRYYEEEVKKLSKSGVVTIDNSDKVLKMQEKPQNPESNWCAPPFYYYTKDDVKKIGVAIKDGCAVDAPGSFVSWLCTKSDVYAMQMPGRRYDIGNLDSYEKVCKEYKGIC